MLTIFGGLSATNRCRTFSERVPRTSGEVRLGITSGQDPTDRVRAVRRSRPESAGRGKTRDFTFLGFTHYCGQRHKSGTFTVWRITAKKRMVAKLKAIKVELQRRMHDRMAKV